MIQIITCNEQLIKESMEETDWYFSNIKRPQAFDDFDINLLDLSFDRLWECDQNSNNHFNMERDVTLYNKILHNSKKAINIIILPQNVRFKYYYLGDKYLYREDLKNMLNYIEKFMSINVFNYAFQLEFENTQTKLNASTFARADFHFSDIGIESKDIVHISEKSNKITTIKANERLFYTTLNIAKDTSSMKAFIESIRKLYEKNNKAPEWIGEVNILDDVEVKKKIETLENEIKNKEAEKTNNLEILESNNEIKTILYETDKKLQKEVMKITDELFEYNDIDFIDEKEEDYRIIKPDITFIIETKGLSRNIKGEDISKTSNHVEMYLDKIEEEGTNENVKGLFIVATQREKRLEDREPTPDRQITLAKRDNILIIRTEKLLKLFEDYRNKKVAADEIIKLFKEQTGEFEY